MKKQIKHFSVHQTSKAIALFYFIIGLIFCIPLGIYALVFQNRLVAVELFVMPFVYWGGVYLVTMGATWIYNQIAHKYGGIEFDLTPPEKE